MKENFQMKEEELKLIIPVNVQVEEGSGCFSRRMNGEWIQSWVVKRTEANTYSAISNTE